MTLDRVSTLLLLLFALSFGFNQEVKAKEIYAVDYSLYGASTYCHNWGGSTGTMWPGTKMTKWNTMKAGGCDIYYCTLAASNNNKVIFHNNNGSQTSDLSFESKYPQPTYANGSWWFSPRVAAAIWGSENNCSAGSHFYFNNTTTNWSDSKLMMIYGDDKNSSVTELTKITNTKLYHASPSKWDKLKYITIVGGSSLWGGGSWGPNNVINATHYTDAINYRYDANNTYYVTPNNSSNCTPISIDYKSGGYSDLNKTQTVKVMVKAAGGSYTEKAYGSWPATIKAKRYKLNSNGASKADETDADLTSATFTSVITSAAKIYVPTPNTGYTFKGWGTSSTATPSNATSAYEYTVDDTKTIYLFFSENTYSITATANPIAGGTVTPTTATAMGQISGGNITATNKTGYYFVNWTVGTATGTFGSSITANTTFKPTQAGTVVANFAENTHNITISNDGNGSTTPSGAQSNVGEVTGISITATPNEGFAFKGWLVTGGTISAQSATTTFKPTADNATIQATFQSTAVYYDLTVGVCSSQSATQGTVSSSPAAGTHIQGGTAFTLTATPATGYEVEGWYSDAACTGDKLQPGGNTYTFSLSATMGVYVKFKEKTFSVTVQAGTGIDQVTGGGAAIGQLTGTAITATVKSGYTWSTWTGGTGTYVNGATVKDNTFRPTAASTLTATATENKYNVTINTNLPAGASLKFGSTAKAWGSVANVGIDSKQAITVTLNAGYKYDGAFSVTGGARVGGSGTDFTVWADGADGTVTVNIKEDLSSNWYLVGSNNIFPAGWSLNENSMLRKKSGYSTAKIGYLTVHVTDIDLNDDTKYQFKVVKKKTGSEQSDTWYGYSHDWEGGQWLVLNKDNTSGTLYTGDENGRNVKFVPNIAGDYEFKVDFSGTYPIVTVTWPIYNCVYGAFNDWSKEDNKLNFGDGDEASTVVNITDVSKSYEFLVLVNSNYLTNNTSYTTPITRNTASEVTFAAKGGSDNNAKFTPDVVGDYTFTYNKSTNKLTITYPTAYKVTFSATEGASGNVSATVDAHSIASGDYVLAGKDVTFTAPAAATDYHFVRWIDGNGDDLSTDNPYTISNISSDVTVKAVYGGTTYAVTISSDGQGEVTPSGVQQVDNIAGREITATATMAGYVFERWETTGNVTVSATDNATTTVKATGEGTVKATYKQAQVVYFKNTLGWSNVYVYIFNQTNVMDATKGVNPKNSSRVAFGQMTLAQGETDVYVYTYDGALENMKSIAFSKDDQNAYENFDNTQASYRGDYSAANPMFVPQTTSNESKNVSEGHETKYFSNGTWFPFSTDKHYYIQFEGEETQYPLVFASEGSLNATITTKNLNAYSTYRFFLYDNAHPIDAQPVSYGRDEVITYDKDATFVSFTNTSTKATVQTITGGDHVFIANFNADVRPQINIDFPAAYTFDYGVGPGGQSATAVRTGTTDTIASGDYVAPEQSVTVTQMAADGCTFGQWNTQADGRGTNLGTGAQYIFDMPASAHTAYALYNGADVPSSFQILGTFNNWASSSYMRSKSIVGELVYDSIYLDAGREYQFKVYNSAGSKWYGNTGIMTQAHCTQWTFKEEDGNCTLATTIAGWYKFTLNKSSISLNVTFPENPKQATMYDSPVKDNNTDVMLQAFYWAHNGNTSEEYTDFGDVKWATLNNEADTLAKYFDMVWLAPSQETADFTGYLPINYSHQGTATRGNIPWGSGTDLRNLIDHLHNRGSKVIADIVINHSSATHADEGNTQGYSWCDWESFDFGRYGVYSPDYTWIAKGDEMFYGKKTQAGDCGLLDNTDNFEDEWNYSYKSGTASWSESEFNCAYSRDWAHKKQEVREMSRAYLSWMRDSIGYDGWRYDFVKGFHGSHIYDYNRSTGAYFSVCEVFDGDAEKQIGVLSDAGSFTYMFDFPGKFSIYNSAIREYHLQNLKENFKTLIGCNGGQYKKYAVTFIDNHDSFHEDGKSLYGTANTIDERQAHQALCYLLSMPGVPCIVYPYWNNYKDICKALIYARKAAGVHSESVVEEDWAGKGGEGDNYYTARIKGAHGYIFLKLGYDCAPQDPPYGADKDPEGRIWIKAWAGEHAGVWYTTSDAQPSKYRLLITCNGQTYYSNSVTENGQDLSYYATKDAKYQWQKYEMFQWKDVAGTTPAAVAENNVYTATFDMTNIAATNVALYTGDYYIRTDEVEGGWNDYKKESHKFTYFNNASVAAGDAYRYYWVNNIAKSKEVNVHATVGNEINEHITNTLGNDEFTNGEGKVRGDANGINIRFSYEPTTNYLGRAMILGSTGDKYLNVVGSNIYKDKNCTVALDDAYYASRPADSKLGDISNWVYEKTVFVKITNDKPASNVVIKSVFKKNPSSAEQTQYMLGFQRDFYGNVTDDPVQYAVLDYGTTKSETAYCIRVIYDFKTNRLVGAWEPVDQEITDDWNIDADVLFTRTENGETAQITFANTGDTISSLKNVLFIMEFEQNSGVAGENFYWFSLPFDCHISSIYGVEDYVTLNKYGLPTQGTWGIQRYDGETRARTGWFKEDTQTFWKWMGKDEVLKAGEGYVLDFDKSCATFNTIGIEEACDDETDDDCEDGKKTVQKAVLRLYFPSDKPGFSMTKTGSSEAVNYEDYTCNIKNRKAQDSNWRLLSPRNYSNTQINTEEAITRQYNDSVLNTIPNFIYTYNRNAAAGERYTAVKATDGFNYKSFSCYMAQFSGSVKWAQFTKADQTSTSVAPRYYTAPGEIQRATLKLVMTNSANEQQDQTFIKLMPNATTGYDANRDLTKIVNSDIAQLYSVSEEVSYAANVLPVESQQIALTVVTPKAGTYTFAMPEGTDGVTATLIDAQDGSRTDLSMWDYTVDLNKGTFAGRFFIEIDIRKTPTQIDVTNPDMLDENGNPIKTVKFLHEDQLYIQRGQHIYDATGKVVK